MHPNSICVKGRSTAEQLGISIKSVSRQFGLFVLRYEHTTRNKSLRSLKAYAPSLLQQITADGSTGELLYCAILYGNVRACLIAYWA